MAISGWSGVPFGSVFRANIEGHPSLNEIRSDGTVDQAFAQCQDDFIPSIADPRVRDFVITGLPPHADWVETDDGHWLYNHQLLSAKGGHVKLESWIEESGDIVTHHVEAPYHWASGTVSLPKSTEGFQIT